VSPQGADDEDRRTRLGWGMAMLQPLGEDLFVVDGPVVRDMGIHFETRMTVARLRDG